MASTILGYAYDPALSWTDHLQPIAGRRIDLTISDLSPVSLAVDNE